VYDAIAQTVRTPQDYEDVTFNYLSSLAGQGCIYSELIISPDHAREVGIPYGDMLFGIVSGVDRALEQHGIECRLSATLIRHRVNEAPHSLKDILGNPHPYVTSVNLAGIEVPGDLAILAPLLKTLRNQGGYEIVPHAGEVPGTEDNIQIAVTELGCKRIGHGIQAANDVGLMELLRDKETVLDISVLSNYFAGIIPDGEKHPVRKLYDFGIPITLSSDDPGLFGTSIYMEYKMANHDFNFTREELYDISWTGAKAAFAENEIKEKLYRKIRKAQIND
jgi:adenosine deaminase